MGGWLRNSGLALVLLVVGVALPVFAQESGEPVSEARALFMAGRSAFDEGRYEAALKYFQTSYEQSHHAALLYNMGQCYDRLRRDEEAIAAFERYLAEEPNPENRAPVEARARALREIIASRNAVIPTTPNMPAPAALAPVESTTTTDNSKPDTKTRAQGWLGPVLTLGAGAVFGITGGILMVVGSRNNDEVEHADLGTPYRDAQADADSANRQWISGQVFLGVGAAALAGGLTWWLVQSRNSSRKVELSVSPTSLRLGGHF